MIYVIAKSVLKTGKKDEFVALYKANLDKVLAENGCISYKLCSEVDTGKGADANALTFVECWESTDHLKAHLATPHMQKFLAAARELRESSTLTVVTPV